MADSKIADLTEDTAPLSTDLLYKVDSTGSAGSDRKVQVGNVGLATPALAVAVYRTTTNQSIPASTITKVQFNAETFDVYGMHDNVSNNTRMTVPAGRGGTWLLRGAGAWVANVNGNRELFWKVNDTTYPPGSNRNANLGGTDAVYMAAPTVLVSLAAGDFVEMVGYQNSGVALDLAVADTTASMVYLGA